MDVKERRPYCSLTKGRRDKERRYTSSSGESEECRVPTQKSYSSSETLKAFDHDSSRLLYGSRVKDTVHREADEYTRPAGQNFNLRQLGICEPAARRGLAFCAEMGLPHRGYTAGSEPDPQSEAVMSPEHAMRLWGRGVKAGRNSCLSSRSNSALTLTDTEHDNKSDSENELQATAGTDQSWMESRRLSGGMASVGGNGAAGIGNAVLAPVSAPLVHTVGPGFPQEPIVSLSVIRCTSGGLGEITCSI
ncbi:hypothetical protein COCON_G00106320 [Conger conger]|uniref:Teneurin N-terminal domain-containing protein n=1 Tax=Conger conger TaxID=82655 RepID=A0A9Q1DJ27_CONCO|nr:hypothetical protein COCON_G00106320 [Conger conger]